MVLAPKERSKANKVREEKSKGSSDGCFESIFRSDSYKQMSDRCQKGVAGCQMGLMTHNSAAERC